MVHDFSAEELSYLAASFAIALADGMDNASIKVMCSFFVNVVGTLNLIIAQRAMLKEKCAPPTPEPPHEPCGRPCGPWK